MEKYSKLFVPIPPDLDLVKKIREKAKESFIKEPVYLEIESFEGYLIPWSNWYGYNGENATKVGMFRCFIDNSLYKIFGENYLKEILYIDWIDEDNFEYINLSEIKQFNEVYYKSYRNGDTHIVVFDNFLRIAHGLRSYLDIGFSNTPKMVSELANNDAAPIFEKLKKRGLYDIEISCSNVRL